MSEKYSGEVKDGELHGYGVYVYADGSVYEGEWKDGKRLDGGIYRLPEFEVEESEVSIF